MAKNRPPGITEAHVRIPLEVLQSPAFIALPASAVKLYLDMLSHLRGTNNGNINAALSELRHRGWRSSATLAKALRQLEAVGLIAKTRQTTGVHRGSKLCNLYRFTDRDAYAHPKLHVDGHKETRDYKHFTTMADAKWVVKEASATTPKEKTTLQKTKRHASETEPIAPVDASDSEVTPLRVASRNETSAATPKPRKPNAGKAFKPIHVVGASRVQ